MYAFLDKWEKLDPTICIHYNGDFFDIPYLYYRISKILGEKQALRLSPIRKIVETLSQPKSPIKIGGISCLDYMLLIKKYIMKEESSYKLNDIGLKYAKLGKVEYNGSLDTLYNEDKEKYIEYNIRDCKIMEALEAKLQFVKLTILISHLCHTPYESIYYNTVLNEGAILTYLKRKRIVAPNKPTTINPSIKEINIGDNVEHQRGTPTLEGIVISIMGDYVNIKTKNGSVRNRLAKTVKKKDPYAGGYLLDPIPGLYSDVSDLDYTSLYPSIIKSLNLGIETLVGRIVTKDNYEQNYSLEKLKLLEPNKIIQIQKLNTKTYKLKSADIEIGTLIELIEENKWTISASGAFYRTDIKSIACEVLEDWFGKREDYRSLKKEAGNKQSWDDYALFDLYQMAFKILQNALYGTYAINGWRFTDGFKICSASITNSGQRLTKESIIYVNSLINKKIKTDNEQTHIIASDTDSLYICLTPLLEKLGLTGLPKEEKIKKLIEISQEIQKKANDNLSKIAKDLFNINKKHYFELKQEVIVERAYWAGKRRYAMYIVNKEGVPIEELDMKGLDLMKSNFPPLFKNFGEKLLKDILFGKSKKEIDEDVLIFKESLNNVKWNKLLKPTGVKKIGEYVASKPRAGEIFSKIGLKCPINTKAAIFTNDLLRFKKLDKQYPTFQIGDKMYIAYLKQNQYKINVIGLNGYNDSPYILEFVEKYIDRNHVFNAVLKNKLEGLYKDIDWGVPVFNRNINKFFSF